MVLVRGGFDRPLASLEEVLQVDRLAMAHPEVPLGAATREALEKLSVAPIPPCTPEARPTWFNWWNREQSMPPSPFRAKSRFSAPLASDSSWMPEHTPLYGM